VAITSGRNVAITDANALNLGTSTISGNLNVTTSGAITDSGNLMVTGATILAAGSSNDITLNSAGNNFSTVGITSGRNVTLVDTNSLDLEASSVSGNLALTTGGAVTQSGALSVAGTTSLTAGAANTDILLNTEANNFAGALSFGGTLTNFRDIGLRNTNAGATVPTLSGLTNLRNLTLTFDSALVNLPALTASGTLNVTAGGAIIDSGNIVVTGVTTLAAGATNDIMLDSAGNNFSTVAVNSGNNVTLRDANALDLATSNVSGNLNVTTAGAITDSGNLVVAGIVTLAAGAANDITLDSAGNNFSTVGVTSGRNVSLTDANALDLGSSNVSGTFNITTNGGLTQSGTLNVTGATTVSAGAANDIILNNASNNFSTVAINSGNNVTLADANALDLGASIVSGTLNVTTNGALSQTGPMTVTGTTTLAAGSGNDITLTNASNDFSAVAVANGRNVALTDVNTLDLGASTISGTLDVSTGGSVTQSGALNVAGNATFAAGASNDITLSNPGNDFSTLAITSGRNVTVQDTNDLNLGASTVLGTLNVTTNGGLTQSGALVVIGVASLTAGSGNNVTLNNVANDFDTVAVTSGNNVTLVDSNGLNLGSSSVSGNLNVTTNGALSQIGALTVAGATALVAGSGNDIALNNAGNDFSIVAVTSGNNVSFRDANNISLGTSTISGNFTVSAGGAIVDGDGAGTNITANSASLTAASSVGSAANPLETAVATLNATANADGVYMAEVDGVTVNNVVANGGHVAVSNTTGDMVINTITATGSINLIAAAGSILDGNGSANNLTAGADSTLEALGGVIGLATDPIEVNVNPGLLGVSATGQMGGVSVDINGTVLPTNALTLINSPPGEVIFNSIVLNPSTPNLANLTGIAAELDVQRVNEDDYFTTLLLDVLGEDFVKVQPLDCNLDDSLRVKLDSSLCTEDDR
jgi:trimeric autotransporter adhesin